MRKNMSRIAIVLITGLLFAAAGLSQSNQYIRNSLNLQNGANFNIGGSGNANVFNAQTHYEIGGQRVLSVFLSPQNNLFAGIDAGASNTTGSVNSFFGIGAGQFNTTGNTNTFIGAFSGKNNTTGRSNTFVGMSSGSSTTTGTSNSFFGVSAGERNTTGTLNAYFGERAGRHTTIGTVNSFFGTFAGENNSLGSQNAFFGYAAGIANKIGTRNTFLGITAGDSNIEGSNNTLIGANTDVGTDGPPLEFATAIGAESVVHSSNTIQLGRISGADTVNISGQLAVGSFGAGSTALCRTLGGLISNCSSSIRYKTDVENFQTGLSLIKKLRPVSFFWIEDEMTDFGLIAEEVGEIEPLLVTKNKDGEIEGVKYDRIGVVLINAVTEQQALIEKQGREIRALKKLICSSKQPPAACK